MDHLLTVLGLGALVACSGSKPAPQLPSGAAPESASTTRTCIMQSLDEYPPRGDSVAIAGDEVTFCFGGEPNRSCWHVEVATKKFTPLPVTSPRAAPPAAKAEARGDGTLKLCGPGGSPCGSFAYPGITKDPAWVGVSDDLSTVAIPDGTTLRIYDSASARLRATIQGWPDSPMPGDAFAYPPTFATPDRMIVWYAWSPVSEQGRIFDMSGTQLAIVGKDFLVLGPDESSWRVHGTEWVIKGEMNSILTIDVKHPSVTSTYELSALRARPRPPKDRDTWSLDVLAVAGTAKRLIIVTGENPTTIGVLDRTTNKLDELEPPRCHDRITASSMTSTTSTRSRFPQAAP